MNEIIFRVKTHSSELHKGEDILRKLPVGTETAQVSFSIIYEKNAINRCNFYLFNKITLFQLKL